MEDDSKKAIPAFPNGMTLRDYFAAKAMQAIISTGKAKNTPELIATAAYEMADLMMQERNK